MLGQKITEKLRVMALKGDAVFKEKIYWLFEKWYKGFG